VAEVITRIASTFTDALSRLPSQEQRAAKVTAIDLQMDPTGKGLSMHRVDRSRDPNFWTVRVNRDLRIVVHRSGESQLIAYVGHHDDAYDWAERRRIEVHPRTGAAQFVELVERIAVPEYGAEAAPAVPVESQRPFAKLGDDDLLDVGVPTDWLHPVRETIEEEVLDLLARLPEEAAEALLNYAADGVLKKPEPVAAEDPFSHPDAARRFRVLENIEELKAALEYPWEKWTVFLHPAQRALIERDWKGPARVAGTAGTGKTIVALHRAVHLAHSNPDTAVLLTTFSKPLAKALERKRDILTEPEPQLRERIEVRTLNEAACELYSEIFGKPTIATSAEIKSTIGHVLTSHADVGFSSTFLFDEWEEVIDAWQLADEAAYAEVPRLGRKTRLGQRQREGAWTVFRAVRDELAARGLTTWSSVFTCLADYLATGGVVPITHIVVDEAQDLTVAQARFLAAFGSVRDPDALFFAGDLGQRIFHLPFSWLRLGIDVRGRSHSLKVNYRTSHQIRAAADRLLPEKIADLDGIEEGRRGTISVFDGPSPRIVLAENEEKETSLVSAFLRDRLEEGMKTEELGVLVRTPAQLPRAKKAVGAASRGPSGVQAIAIITMHEAKGLEFRAVAVMACDEDVLPDPERLESVGDEADLEAAYETERHLLYVACTRARDQLMVSAVTPGSEFLEDFRRDPVVPTK
jgi:hypothetical protein